MKQRIQPFTIVGDKQFAEAFGICDKRTIAQAVAEPKCYTVEEAADILRVHPRTIYGWINNNVLEPALIGGATRISKAEIERVINLKNKLR